MAGRLMTGFRDQSDLGEQAHLAEGANSHFDSLDQKVHLSAHLTTSLALGGSDSLPLQEAVTLVDLEAEGNAGGSYAQVILVVVENAHGLVAIALCTIEPVHTEAAVDEQRLASELQSQWSSYLGECDVTSRAMTMVRRPVKYLQSDAVQNENARVEPGDSCYPSEGIWQQSLVAAVNRRVCQIAHGVAKQVDYGKVNVVDDHQLARLASVVEVTEPVKVET
ncbi:MAG: hypothetical protein Q9173_000680 [Seirophora scorigena]